MVTPKLLPPLFNPPHHTKNNKGVGEGRKKERKKVKMHNRCFKPYMGLEKETNLAMYNVEIATFVCK